MTLTIEDVKERLKKIHGDELILDESTYKDTKTKARFIDKDFGEWWTNPNNVICRGSKHLKRTGRKLTIEEVKKRLKKTHGDELILDEQTYKDTQIKARFIDKDFGEWWAKPNNVICRGSKHPKRMREKLCKLLITPVNIVKEKLYKIHGDIVTIDESTYKSASTKARFIDKDFGEWWATPRSIFCHHCGHPKRAVEKTKQTNLKRYGVEYLLQNEEIKEKKKQTMLKRHGVEHSMQNPEIALKAAKAQNNSYVLIHWFSHEEVVCTAGYEKATVEYFNKNQIDYNWQPQVFLMPNGKTFRPDCYLPDQDLWVEIKGYFREDAKEKWDWFYKEHPNSELWDQTKLKEMKIL